MNRKQCLGKNKKLQQNKYDMKQILCQKKLAEDTVNSQKNKDKKLVKNKGKLYS